MREYTHISDAVELANDKAEYDTPLKHILANKDVSKPSTTSTLL